LCSKFNKYSNETHTRNVAEKEKEKELADKKKNTIIN